MTSARQQFGRTAGAYAASAVHARGWDLDLLARIVDPRADGVLVDIGTGAGHTLAALAGKRPRLIGLDPTPEMLGAASGLLRERGVAARLVQGEAGALPFAAGAASLITCRIAAHHFPDASGAFAEMARILAPGGSLYFIDNYAPDDPALDDFINSLERLRDPSHVREQTLGEWQRLLSAAGLRPAVIACWRTRIDLDDWLDRAHTPPANAAMVRRRLREAAPEAAGVFAIDPRGFSLHKAFIVGTTQ